MWRSGKVAEHETRNVIRRQGQMRYPGTVETRAEADRIDFSFSSYRIILSCGSMFIPTSLPLTSDQFQFLTPTKETSKPDFFSLLSPLHHIARIENQILCTGSENLFDLHKKKKMFLFWISSFSFFDHPHSFHLSRKLPNRIFSLMAKEFFFCTFIN